MNFKDLIAQNGLAHEDGIEIDQVERYLKRARKDLLTAKRVLAFDEAASLDLVYKAMFHASNGLIRLYHLRPGKIRQHKAVVEATKRILGNKYEVLILEFDKLRQKRNYFEYGANFTGSKEELKNAFSYAEKLVSAIEKQVETKNPQKKLF